MDYAWRSEHEMTVAAKTIIEAFYGSAPRLSYWNGCSAGGKQALKEAQRFPAARGHDRENIFASDGVANDFNSAFKSSPDFSDSP